jgi:diketogulonate reductase-like aldo/keto reductase
MERLVDAGLIKSIGLSNANTTVILDLWSYARIKPVANQIELHPYFVQNELVAFHEKLGIKVIAYAPLSASAWSVRDEKLKGLNLLGDEIITKIATKHGKSAAQVILNWHLARGHLILPKTTKVERLAENH